MQYVLWGSRQCGNQKAGDAKRSPLLPKWSGLLVEGVTLAHCSVSPLPGLPVRLHLHQPTAPVGLLSEVHDATPL